MAEEKDTDKKAPVAEKVDKKPSGKTVIYCVPGREGYEQSMPKEDWDRLTAERSTRHLKYLREE